MKLITGHKYDTTKLEFAGWMENGETQFPEPELKGYNCWEYFDEGTYLGPDIHGIEPSFDVDCDYFASRKASFLIAVCGLLLLAMPASADIYRWDNGEVIPGTEGVDIVPGTRVWNLDLHFADLTNRDMSQIKFDYVHMAYAKLNGSDLTGTEFRNLSMPGVDFTGANLTRITMPSLHVLALDGAIFTDANITEANLREATAKGFTAQNLYSTANYKNHDLHGINWGYNQPINWDFSGQDLSGGKFERAILSGANFTVTNLSGADMRDAVVFAIPDVAPEANFTDADITNAVLSNTFSAAQMQQTKNYKEDKLAGITLASNWNLAGIDLSGKDLRGMIIEAPGGFENANLSGANVTGIDFRDILLRGANLTGAIGYVDPNVPPPIPGDANLDGFFNSGDLVQVFTIGEYEDDIADNSTWNDGDWNGDLDFNTTDLVTAFQAGRYEAAPAAVSVPEPTGWLLATAAALAGMLPRRACRNRVDCQRSTVS